MNAPKKQNDLLDTVMEDEKVTQPDQHDIPEQQELPPTRPAKRWILRTLLALGILTGSGAAFAWYVYQSAQIVPEYYQTLLEQPIEQLDAAGDAFESQVLELQNKVIETGDWQADFTQDQINGWLASDMPQKFPNSIPANVTQPRVSLDNNELKLVFRFESKRFSGIVEVSGDAYCTETLNQIAIRINFIKSGLISLPIEPWTERISTTMQKNNFPISWTEIDGDTIALISLPQKMSEQSDQKRIIESIEILDGQISLKGITLNPEDVEAYQASNKVLPETQPIER